MSSIEASVTQTSIKIGAETKALKDVSLLYTGDISFFSTDRKKKKNIDYRKQVILSGSYPNLHSFI